MTLEELKVVITAQTEGLKKEVDNVKKQLGGLQSETTKTTSGIMSAFKKLVAGVIALKIGQKIGQAITNGIKDAMNVEAAIQQIKRIMGESSNQFLKWSKTQALAFNMSQGQALKYGSIFGNLVSGFSSSTAEITKNTEDVLKASSVIASATGRTMDDVMERIRSGLLGNTESIEDLGVNVNVAMIQSTDAFKRFANGKSWQQIDFQTQQQIRLFAILEQTSKKYGETVNQNTSTQLAQLVAVLGNVKLALGQAFLPIVQIILPMLTSLAQGLYNVISVVAQFSQALFGKNTSNQQATATAQQAKAVNGLGNAYQNTGSKAKKAAKEIQGSLAGFDEINQLQFNDNNADANSDGANGGDTGSISVPPIDTGSFANSTIEISNKVQKMADRVKKAFNGIQSVVSQNKNKIVSSLAGIGAGIGTYLIGTHWDDIMKIVPKAMGIVSKAIGSINAPVVAIAILIGLVVKAVIELWKENQEFRDNIIKAWNGIKDTLTNIWNTILKPIFKAFTDMLLDIWNDGLKPLWDKWKEFVKQIVLLITDLWNGLKPVVDWIVKVFGPVIVDVFKGAYNQIKNVVMLIINIVSSIIDAFSGVTKGIRQNLSGWIDFITGVFTGDWSKAWNGIKNIFGGLKTEISSIWNGIKDIFGAIISYVGNYFKNAWNTGWDSVKGIFGGVFNGLKDIASNVFNSIKNTITNIIDGIKNTISGIKTTFSNVFNSLKDIIKAPLNAIISAINNSLGKISISIPSWVGFGIGGKTFSIPKIPALATGGITDVNNPFLAVVGDNKTQREVVAPLDDLQGMIASSVGTAVLNAMQFGGGNNSQPTGDLYLQIDGTTFARIIKPYQAKESQRVGNNLIIKTT